VVVQHAHPEHIPPSLQEAFNRLEQRLNENPDLQERATAIRRRLEEAETALDPVAHFEELTGHSLSSDVDTKMEDAEATAPADPSARDRDAAAPSRSVIDQLVHLPLALQLGGAAVALLLGTYAVLFTVSEASESTLDRLAAVKVSDQMVESYYTTNTRSATPTSDTLSASSRYLNGLSSLRSARTSTVGLFPSYHPDSLEAAESHLTSVLQETKKGSFLALEAQFYLGKVHLAQGRVDAARTRFRTVVEQEGRLAQDAQDILETLREEYPSNKNDANS
jgi:TolA-binding protein